MSNTIQLKLQKLSTESLLSELKKINRGIEKEGLRTALDGKIAHTNHPLSLGSALTHPYITTDYSEALLEFITPVFQTAAEVVAFLDQTHRFCYSKLDNELIWTSSMPCFLKGEESIPIAHYGSSNMGKLKYIYRVGLAHRYGKMMQSIAGIHYNFSLPETFWEKYEIALTGKNSGADFQTESYFSLIRNFRRYSWLLLYLYGASPALCPSFLQGREHQLEQSNGSLLSPFATSLRMGGLGYHNRAQQKLGICYNSLERYIDTLGCAMKTPYAPYENIGVLKNGEYRQLNSNILQIENEYYSDIRPKRVTPHGQKPLQVLEQSGVEYIEIRNLDINPYLPLGIDEQQICFLDCFMLYCLLHNSPLTTNQESCIQEANKQLVVNNGRKPRLKLQKGLTQDISLIEWGMEIFTDLLLIAKIMDEANNTRSFTEAVKQEQEKLRNVNLTPSARIIQDLGAKNTSFFQFGQQQSVAHKKYFMSRPLSDERSSYFNSVSSQSIEQQAKLERQDQLEFKDYLQQYLN